MNRQKFEKAYQPDPRKSPFPFFKFNEETNLYEGYSFDEHEVAMINSAWLGWQLVNCELKSIIENFKHSDHITHVDDFIKELEEVLDEQ